MAEEKNYMISWIALLQKDRSEHTHETIKMSRKFASIEDAMEWAKSRLTIEVQEADDQGLTVPLLHSDEKKTEWGFWHPGMNEPKIIK